MTLLLKRTTPSCIEHMLHATKVSHIVGRSSIMTKKGPSVNRNVATMMLAPEMSRDLPWQGGQTLFEASFPFSASSFHPRFALLGS